MNMKGLIAYPKHPNQVGSVVRLALNALRAQGRASELHAWEELDVCGNFIASTVLGKIEAGEILVADITNPNFNVAFEIGFAIGRGKRVGLVRHAALHSPQDLIREVGVFDTLGYAEYSRSAELADIIDRMDHRHPLALNPEAVKASPVYLLMPRVKTDAEIRIQARIKKVRLPFRSFDPEEHGRLPAAEAIDQVGRSVAVVVPLISNLRKEAAVHNLRAAFVSGLAMGMEKLLLLLQEGDDPVPIDYRDLVKRFKFPNQIDEYVAEMASGVTEKLLDQSMAPAPEARTLLERLDLGASSAENELQNLGSYYLETDEFQRTLRGEIRVVTGRKGSGKTAMFAQLRDRLRRDPHRIVLDLKPEGYQLVKFKERVLDLLDAGTREHTVTAFWEYLLLLEACHKILQKDQDRHLRDESIYELYVRLSELTGWNDRIGEADFSERMLELTEEINTKYGEFVSQFGASQLLTTGQITEMIHSRDVAAIREVLIEYLHMKEGLWILFDNLDKGWPSHGVTEADVLILRCFLDAIGKIERMLRKSGIDCHGVVFVRNDVYELLVTNTPDRGKISQVVLDWSDPDLLRELLRRRLLFTAFEGDPRFEEIWPQVCISHYGGEESAQYMIDRALMRPRALLDLVQLCKAHAVNMRHLKIDADDIRHGEENYSAEMLANLGFEIQDVMPSAREVLYEFVEEERVLSPERIKALLEPQMGPDWGNVRDLLLWFGFLGIVRDDGQVTYIHDVRYDAKRLRTLAEKRGGDAVRYAVNPAFWPALEMRPSDRSQLGFGLDES